MPDATQKAKTNAWRLDRGVGRFVAWVVAAVAVSLILYRTDLGVFLSLLNGQLDQNFGTAFPAIPFAALLGVLFVFRWGELHGLLVAEGALMELVRTRLVGAAMMLIPLPLLQYSANSLPLSAVSLILVFYGAALLINPSTVRILFPYAALCAAGVSAPSVITYFFGEPLVGVATDLSAMLVRASGIPVSWDGPQFEFVSRVGGQITGVVTPGCSSVLSVTTFLGLLGLMYFDMRRSVSSTLKLAVVGTCVLVVLNSARIGILIWAGYVDGSAALWGLHNWIGYAIFMGFYLVVLVVYARMSGPKATGPRLGLSGSHPSAQTSAGT